MKRHTTLSILLAITAYTVLAEPTHLDIMVPDLQDTDLKGPVKSVSLKVSRNVNGEWTTEKSEYDRTGNLTCYTEFDAKDKLIEKSEYFYDENGCYTKLRYRNEEDDYESEWDVTLSPDTLQIALREKSDGRIGLETYSPEGYLINYRLVTKDREPILTREYQRDEKNRRVKYTRIKGRKPEYTFYYKWAENGLIDMQGQVYHQEKAQFRHTYEYLVIDEHGNWTQRILVRYDISGKKPVKVYEHTVKRDIEYFAPDAEEAATATSDDTSESEEAPAEEDSGEA
ncbi:MAG: hypothetical protein JXR25_04540 [Pontiellaceae bacterium]|nr:hypothetical protein [Pontiellaceae bacterium]MBN2784073.1 hypothetical protein [Pontiellaceae bacterium]